MILEKITKYFTLATTIFVVAFLSCRKESSTSSTDEEYTSNDMFVSCSQGYSSDNTTEILTWNLEHFPQNINSDAYVRSIVSKSDYDIWAFQEVENTYSIKTIAAFDKNYSVIVDSDLSYNVNNNYHLAFAYKNTEFNLIEKKILTDGLFSSQDYFPRKCLQITLKSKRTNEEIILINLHLKCCGTSSDKLRRQGASKVLHDYITSDELDDKNVIVLGDYNNVIYPSSSSDMTEFLNDSANFKFSDENLAKSSSSYDKSYILYNGGSHIDHILITNELFDNLSSSHVLPLDNCNYSLYINQMSDHRPVISIFN